MIKKCQDCVHFKLKMYSKDANNPDSRCNHHTAQVGRDLEGNVVSLLTIREARLPRTDRKENFPDFVREYNQCGPEGTYYKHLY